VNRSVNFSINWNMPWLLVVGIDEPRLRDLLELLVLIDCRYN
jgi:hypothetical protein